MPAGHAIVVVLIALVLGALLNADDLRATAERQELGATRDLAMAATRPLQALSSALLLNRPRAGIDVALGREPAGGRAPALAAEPSPSPSLVAAAPSPTPTGRRTPTPEDPLRLFVGGDSMVGQFGPMLKNEADKTGLITTEFSYEFESGLTRPDFIDWPARLRDVRATFDPDVMVLYFGGNDAQPLKIDGVVEEPGTPAWQEEYRSRVRGVMAELTADGREVWWMGMPIVKSQTFQPRVDMLNAIYRSEAEAHEGVTYFSTHELFAGPDGAYAEYLPDESGAVVDMRLNDGVHYTTAGAKRAARAVLPEIARAWEIALPE